MKNNKKKESLKKRQIEKKIIEEMKQNYILTKKKEIEELTNKLIDIKKDLMAVGD